MSITVRIAPLAALVGLLVWATALAGGDRKLPAGHRSAACTDCHQVTASVNGDAGSFDAFGKSCLACHDPKELAESATAGVFHARRDRDCLDCHSFHNTNLIRAAGREFTIDGSATARQFRCRSCHESYGSLGILSDGHRNAAAIYHADDPLFESLSPSEQCLVCHSQVAARLPESIAIGSRPAPVFDQHGSHPIGVMVIPGKGDAGNRIRRTLSTGTPLFAGRIECISCHSLSAGRTAAGLRTSSQNDLCRSCHEVDR